MKASLCCLLVFLLSYSFAQNTFDFENFAASQAQQKLNDARSSLTRSFVTYNQSDMVGMRDDVDLYTLSTFFPSGATAERFTAILVRTPYSADVATPLLIPLGQPGFVIVVQVFFFFFFFFFLWLLLVVDC